jgi:hypothetical protein
VLSKLGVHFKLEFHHIPKRLHAPTEDLLTIGLRADAFAIVAWEEELEDGVFVVEVSHRIRDYWPSKWFV